MRKFGLQFVGLLVVSAVMINSGVEAQAQYYVAPAAVVPAPAYVPAPGVVYGPLGFPRGVVVPAQAVVVQPAAVYVQTQAIVPAGAVVPAPVVTQSPVVVSQPAPVVVDSAAVVPVGGRYVRRGLFRTTKETVYGEPGNEVYNYHQYRLLGRDLHYSVRNDNGVVRVRSRGF